MSHLRQIGIAFLLGLLITALAATVALALNAGERNGQDLNCCGWIGNDNPDGLTGTYAYDNVWHDVYLSEWAEPNHDWVRDRFLRWGVAAEQKLNNEAANKGVGLEIRVHDQFFYNYGGNWQTNLPWSGAADSENAFEELQQGYTEIDVEIQDGNRINSGFNYFWDLAMDAEKAPEPGKPVFYSEIEYCNNNFNSCNWDVTGRFQKKVQQQ